MRAAAGAALAVSTVATSCFVGSRVALAPSPDPAPVLVQARALATIDTIARSHGLSAQPTSSTHDCFIGLTRSGTYQSHWRDGSLQMSVCAERSHPYRLEISVLQSGLKWNDKGRKLRDELPNVLRARFGTEVVTVERNR